MTTAEYLQARTVARLVRDGIPAALAAKVAEIHEFCWGAHVAPHQRAVFLEVEDQKSPNGWNFIRLGTNPEAAAIEDAILASITD